MAEVRKWLEILVPIVLLGGAGSIGMELRGVDRYADNAEYIDQTSVEMLEMELKYNIQISEFKERLMRLEKTHEK